MIVPLSSSSATALKGDVTVPGDKSISHRALMLSSQVLGTTRISGLLEGEDVINTGMALQQLGVNINRLSEGVWEVQGVGVGGLSESAEPLDMGNSGTSTRLMMGLVTPYPFATSFTGDHSLSSRPMQRVITPLTEMGARVESTDGKLPLTLHGTDMPMPIRYISPVASAQVKSAVIFAGLNTPGRTTVIEKEATRDHTENMLRYLGFDVQVNGNEISIVGQQEPPRMDRDIPVPADPSSAAFPVVAALITPGSNITIKNVCINPLRTGLFKTLKEMGADIEYKNPREVAGEKVADLVVKYSKLRGVTVPSARAPSMIDEYPVLSVAAAFAQGETVMHGLAELRVKESDRLAAIIAGLGVNGVAARAQGDTLYVMGAEKVRGGGTVETHYDHRTAMAFLIMGMATEQPVTVDDASAIATSFPNFREMMNALGAKVIGPSFMNNLAAFMNNLPGRAIR